MICKNKIYTDGEYTLCTKCKKSLKCTAVKACVHCGNIEGVFYDKKSDFFMCARCFNETEETPCVKAK